MKVVYLDDLAAADLAAANVAPTQKSSIEKTDQKEKIVLEEKEEVLPSASSLPTKPSDSSGSDLREVVQVPAPTKKDKKGVLWDSFDDFGPVSM